MGGPGSGRPHSSFQSQKESETKRAREEGKHEGITETYKKIAEEKKIKKEKKLELKKKEAEEAEAVKKAKKESKIAERARLEQERIAAKVSKKAEEASKKVYKEVIQNTKQIITSDAINKKVDGIAGINTAGLETDYATLAIKQTQQAGKIPKYSVTISKEYYPKEQ